MAHKSDERFARQYRCGPPPEFPLASPRSGIVHHLSGPDRYALTRTLLRRSRSVGGATLKGIPPISFLTPYGFTGPLTRTHVKLLGPCFKTGRMGSPQADARSTQMPRHAERRVLLSTENLYSTSLSVSSFYFPRYRSPFGECCVCSSIEIRVVCVWELVYVCACEHKFGVATNHGKF
jgi:hypothetical protein